MAQEPSFRPEALPAVTLPPSRKTARCLPSFSRVGDFVAVFSFAHEGMFVLVEDDGVFFTLGDGDRCDLAFEVAVVDGVDGSVLAL